MSMLSPLTRGRALRRLLFNGGFWGAYGQIIVVTGPIFTGFALWMGLDESDIALTASIVALAGLLQPVSFILAGKLANQKRFIILVGLFEITVITCVILIPLITAALRVRFILAAAAILTGMSAANIVAPLLNSWLSELLPDNSRARELGRRLIVMNFAAMVIGYGAGRFIDLFPRAHLTFIVPYLAAWIVGISGYLVLLTVPFPANLHIEGKITLSRTLVVPFRNESFRNLLIFTLLLTFGGLVAEPFFNVFMIRDLGVSYATIAILNAIALGTSILGYWGWGKLATRFGNKPVIQLLAVPRFLIPLFWVFLTPANSVTLLVLIVVMIGFTYSGITVAINTLLFGILAGMKDRSAYFAIWSLSSAIIVSLATALGGLLTRITASIGGSILGFQFTNIRMMFVISSALLVIPVLFLRRVHDTEAKPVIHLLGKVFRGNPLSFAYNSFVYYRTGQNQSRVKATRNMGKSKSPMAVDHLARAMDDVNPAVREEAARGLGKTKAPEAVRHLAGALEDDESDIRAEAAESLGKLRHPEGVDPLLKALDSDDVRVAISAARALGVIGGKAIGDRLYARLQTKPNKMLLPSLVESLSMIGDRRVVETALSALTAYRSPVVRLQLINAACRALGARDLFYTLLSKNAYELAEKLDQRLKSIGRRLKGLHGEPWHEARRLLGSLAEALESGRYEDMAVSALGLAELLAGADAVVLETVRAIRLYQKAALEEKADRPEIFYIICIGIVADSVLKKISPSRFLGRL